MRFIEPQDRTAAPCARPAGCGRDVGRIARLANVVVAQSARGRVGAPARDASVHLVVAAEVHQEAHLAIPAEQHSKVVVHRERPVVTEVASELVRPEEGIAWIGREPSQSGSEQLVAGWLELPRPPREPRRYDESHGRRPSAPEVVQQFIDVHEGPAITRPILGLRLPDLAKE